MKNVSTVQYVDQLCVLNIVFGVRNCNGCSVETLKASKIKENFISASGGGFSFGNSDTSGQSFMSIFSGGDSTPDPGKQAKETSFSFNFGGDTSLF